jgi:hypothetical protein
MVCVIMMLVSALDCCTKWLFYHVVCFPAIADFSSCVNCVYTFGRFCDYCLSGVHLFVFFGLHRATLLYLHMFPRGLVISCFPAVQVYTGRFVYSVCSHL